MTARAPAKPATDRVIARIRKNAAEELRVVLGEFNGQSIVHVRVWYDDGAGAWRPTKKGVAFHRNRLADVIEGLVLAEQMAGGGEP